jgi:photosystem II stability/assembly factor-like uncharacterized protein
VKRTLGLLLVTTLGCAETTNPFGPDAGTGGTAGQNPGGGSGGSNPTGGGGGGTPTGGAGGMPTTGGGWVNVTGNLAGTPSECGNMSFVTARPDRDMVIAGIAQQGLWAISDGASAWTQLGASATSAKIINRTTSIVFDPMNPDVFWESGIYNGGGAYRTNDNGKTFVQLGDVSHSDMISVDLNDPARKTLFAATHEQVQKAFLSTDGGMTWNDIGKNIPLGGYSISPHVIDDKTLLMGTSSMSNQGIARSTDGGATFTRVYTGGVVNRVLAAADGNFYWSSEGSGIVKSTDKGATWTKIEASNVTAGGSMSLVELPDGRLVSLGPQKLAISSDKGATWQSFGPDLPQQHWGLAYSKQRKAFYSWYFTCSCFTALCAPVPGDAISKLDFDYEKK